MNLIDSMLRLRRLALALLLAVPLVAFAADQQTFPTPEAAADALMAALKANDDPALVAMFGEKHKNIIGTGDRARDAEVRARAAEQMATYRYLSERGPDRRVLLMGTQAWPLPIPGAPGGRMAVCDRGRHRRDHQPARRCQRAQCDRGPPRLPRCPAPVRLPRPRW